MTIKMWRRGEGGNLRKGRGDGEGANGKGEAFHLVLDMPHICIIGSNPSFIHRQYIYVAPLMTIKMWRRGEGGRGKFEVR